MENDFEETFNVVSQLHHNLVIEGEILIKLLKPLNEDDAEQNLKGVARSLVLSSSHLSLQILNAISNNHILIAFCGLRTLLEYDIKTNFIFDHPEHQNDLLWMQECAKDVFLTTNDIKKNKSRLKNKGLDYMASKIKRVNLYAKNYAALSDYSHLPVRAADIHFWDNEKKCDIKNMTVTSGVAHLSGIISTISSGFSIPFDEELNKKCIDLYNEMTSLDKQSSP